MPDYPIPPSQRKKSLDASLQQLKNYVRLKAAQEPATTAVDLETTKAACLHLFANFTKTQEAGDYSTHAIPDILEVIRHTEMYRLRIVQQADLALNVWQEYYKKEDPKSALSDEEATAIEKIAKPDKNWREVYLNIVDKLVGLDLHYIFISKNWSLSEFMVRLFEYSPSSFRSIQGHQPSPFKFVSFLSEEEQQSVTIRCKKSLKRASELHKSLLENYPDGFVKGLNSPDFEEKYPPPFEAHRVRRLIKLYLQYVSDTYDTLTTILPIQTKDNE